jgi:tRNA-2-methylthio-N6-dimethylallyladenosine synthase
MPSNEGPDPGSYYIRTFGCQMNMHDSEHIAGILERSGFSPASGPEHAGLLVFNTCSVRESAEDRVWGNLASVTPKRDGLPIVVVCGCMAERFGVEILHRCPSVDLVLGLDSLSRLPGLIERCRRSRVCDTGRVNSLEYEQLPTRRGGVSRAWVPVSHGCDNHCTYCVVPYVRGGQVSRKPEEITAEVEELTSDGVIEVTLLGQNVNSYGRDLGGGTDFADLLARIAGVTGIRRVKFETSHPRDLSDRMLEVMAFAPAICEYLHLPLQAGSDRVLAEMNRGYSRDYYRERIALARRLVPGLVVSTDIMVGFPGETDADFADTLSLVETVRFDSTYIFMYSRRGETPAAGMEGEVSRGVKAARFDALQRVQGSLTRKSLQMLVGRVEEVLVEACARKGDYNTGRTRGHQVVLLPAEEAPVGALVRARIETAGAHAVRGRVEDVVYDPNT